MRRLHSSAGIAIGPILFVLAMLGILATVFAAGSNGSLGSASVADRVTNDIVGQANLIRSKISECQMQYLINGTNFATSGDCINDPYPCSDQTNGSLVSALTCPNDPLDGTEMVNLWTGIRVASLPPPTKGFDNWMYFNGGEAGGRCIWTTSTGKASAATMEGLGRAAQKFTGQEFVYNSSSSTPKIVVFITRPTGPANSHCTVP